MRPGDWRLVPIAEAADRRLVRPLSPRFRKCSQPYQPLPGVKFSCRKCENCLARMVQDAVGRCLAENLGSEAAFFITLTVGGDRSLGSIANNPKALAFHKADVQAYNKRLRKYICEDAKKAWVGNGNDPQLFVAPSVRYFYVGELGDKKGRVHYHQLLFLEGATGLPDALLNQNFFWGQMWDAIDVSMMEHVPSARSYWPWGFANIKPFKRNDAYYLATYVTKTVEERSGLPAPYLVMAPSRSLRPMLGAGYFDLLASRHVDHQLPLRDDGYRLPPEFGYEGPLTVFHMSRIAKLRYAASYSRQWSETHGEAIWPKSEFLDRLQANEDQRVRQVWFEGQQFMQRFRQRLEVNRRVEAEKAQRGVFGDYRSFSDGDRLWGVHRSVAA